MASVEMHRDFRWVDREEERDTENPKVDCQELRLGMLMTSPGEKEFTFSNINSAANGALAQYGLHPLFKNSP